MRMFLRVWLSASFSLLLATSAVTSAEDSPSKFSLTEYRRSVLAAKGDFNRGQIFYNDSEKSRCKICHAIEGNGSLIGPDLLGVGTRYDRASLLDAILEPSAKIHPEYAATIIVTKAGKIFTGIARQINENDVEIAVSEKERNRVSVDEIAERKASPISAMPAGLDQKISPAEMADLLTYLSKLKPTGQSTRQEALDPREIPRAIDYVNFKPIIDPGLAFQRPVWFGAIPGIPQACLVLEIDQGKIWLLEGEGNQARKTLFVDVSSETTGGEFTGLMSLAFHPNFEKNRRYFLKLHAIPPTGKAKIRDNALTVNIIERRASADARSDSGEPSKIVMQIPCFTVFHHGGDLAFGHDGFLYSTMGDTGPQGDPDGHSQDLGVLCGKMFRIDVDKIEGGLPYAIPPDNPFRNRAGARPEIWASGFREIWRFSFDSKTGDLWAGDVGQSLFEEIDIVRPGENYGWNVIEGLRKYSDRYRSTDVQYAPPVIAYSHVIGSSVTGGFVYRGKKHVALYGKYIFGDYETRRVWAIEQHDRKIHSIIEIGRAPDHLSSFGVDADGELYVVGLDFGLIYRIEPQNADLIPATSREIVGPSFESGEPWRYSTEMPSPAWMKKDFDDAAWDSGVGAFGLRLPADQVFASQPGAARAQNAIRTEWSSADLWLRREFTFAPSAAEDEEPSIRREPSIVKLRIRLDGEAEIFLNGILAARITGTGGENAEIPLFPEARQAIQDGNNVVAVHCKKIGIGQQIDVGMIELQRKN